VEKDKVVGKRVYIQRRNYFLQDSVNELDGWGQREGVRRT